MNYKYHGITISDSTAPGRTFTDGDGFISSDWAAGIGYDPKPKTAYTIGGVPKRSIPIPRFTAKARLCFEDEHDLAAFKDMFYDSTVQYLAVTFSTIPPGKDTNTLAMNFDGDIGFSSQSDDSLEITVTLVEVPHVRP